MSKERIYGYEILREGGSWLGAARTRLQSHGNGDRVTWGSDDVIQPPLTVRQVEEIVAEAVAAFQNDLPKDPTRYQCELCGYDEGLVREAKTMSWKDDNRPVIECGKCKGLIVLNTVGALWSPPEPPEL